MLDSVGAPLEANYRVAAFDRRGHGRTADTPAPFDFWAMADETISLLTLLADSRPAVLVGHSDGAITALHVALRRPDLVSAMVLIGGSYHYDGTMPSVFDDDEDDLAAGDMLDAYASRSPDGPEHFPTIVAKTMQLWKHQPTLTVEQLATITQPTLVLVGDDDSVTMNHTCSLYEGLGAAQLAVVPGASHLLMFEKPELTNLLIGDFLADRTPPQTYWPQRRALHPSA